MQVRRIIVPAYLAFRPAPVSRTAIVMRMGIGSISSTSVSFRARAAEEVRHRVIPLVTCVLVDLRLVRQLRDGNDGLPRFGKRRWILDRDLVLDRVGIG